MSLSIKNPKLAKQWSSKNTLTPNDVSVNSTKKVWWLCEKNHEWEASVSHRNNGRNCPYCSNKKVCEDNCLATINPELAKQWSSKNILTPKDVTQGSEKKVWWICEKNHEWKARIADRNKGNNCPYCSGNKVCEDNCLATINPELVKQWHPTKNGNLTPKNFTSGSNKKVWWICENNHEWKAKIYHRSGKQKVGCPYCAGKKVCEDNCLATTHPELSKEWSSKNGNLTPNKVTAGSNMKVWWICKNNHEWKAQINRKDKNTCPYCSGNKVCEDNCLSTINPELAKQWSSKNVLTPDDVTSGSDKKIWWICENNHEWKARVAGRNNGSKCPYCSNKKVCKDNCLDKINPELAKEWNYKRNGDLTPKDVLPRSHKKVWWICKNNHEWNVTICNRYERGCPHCSKNISKVSTKWLNNKNIKKREKLIKINGKRFFADGFKDNVVYEFLGDFWHGNPAVFNPNKVNKKVGKMFYTLLYKTINKLNTLCENGYKVIYRWEGFKKDCVYEPILASKSEIIKTAVEIYQSKKKVDILKKLCKGD